MVDEVRAQSKLRDSDPWVIRTDVSSDESWKRIRESIAAPQSCPGIAGEFYAYVAYVDDARFQNRSPQDVVRLLPDDYLAYFCFVADSECIQNTEHPVLVVGFYPTPADYESFTLRKPSETAPEQIATFRALPSQVQSIQNNFSIANMDFAEFARSVDPDGVFRVFRR